MTHFPHMMAFVLELSRKEKKMEINDILNQLADEGILEPMIEPIDDPSIQTDFYDWADVVGILDQVEPDVEWA
jgi:glyceraldehyde-3-phosphate dehydrogenase/erythrose-4-phosphate dehydrogenase